MSGWSSPAKHWLPYDPCPHISFPFKHIIKLKISICISHHKNISSIYIRNIYCRKMFYIVWFVNHVTFASIKPSRVWVVRQTKTVFWPCLIKGFSNPSVHLNCKETQLQRDQIRPQVNKRNENTLSRRLLESTISCQHQHIHRFSHWSRQFRYIYTCLYKCSRHILFPK